MAKGEKLTRLLAGIKPANPAAIRAAEQRQDSLAKPPGSLGELEEISVRMAGITGQVINSVKSGCVIVFCADNGVVSKGVASAPTTVTRAQTMNFTRRLTGVGTLSKCFGSELLIVDVGVKDPIPEELYDDIPLRDTGKIVDRRIRPGTWDISEGPAMTEEEALTALLYGAEMAEAAAESFDIIGVGEMGIGNTTTSAAVLSAVTGLGAEKTCGRGGGVNDRGFQTKKEIVDRVTEEYRKAGGLKAVLEETKDARVRAEECLRMLARCGGFDLCAMTGAFLAAAACRTPAVIDGYISVAAALCAAQIVPEAVDYMFVSHKSKEPGYELAVSELGLKPFLALGMRLGEGSGCPIAFEIIRGACDVMKNMATFEEAAINDEYLEEVRRGGCF